MKFVIFVKFIVFIVIIQEVLSYVSSNIHDFAKNCLDTHNLHRSKHQAPPLVLNYTLGLISQEWAEKLYDLGKLQIRPRNHYGENLYAAFSSNKNFKIACSKAVDSWYSQVSRYNYGDEYDSSTNQFTQVVWKNCRQLGVGFVSNNGKNFVVCNYYPPGNYAGQFHVNVLPPLS